MAEGNFGGGGSVHWNVKVNNADPEEKKWPDSPPNGARRRAGVDQEHGDSFSVTVAPPGATFSNEDEFIAWLRSTGQLDVPKNGTATFVVEIDRSGGDQVQIRW